MMDSKVIKLFSEKNLVFIATLMKDGSPQLSPVWANYEDGFILVNTAEGRIKHKNILRDPRVAVSVTSNDYPFKQDGEKRIIFKIKPERVFVLPELKMNE
jgi:predicted pyridoxine 5'-phosphate oxidase superfamily flavin-nucleotide-binding protein